MKVERIKMKMTFKRIGLALIAILFLILVAFTIWAYTPLGPMDEAVSALDSSSEITVEIGKWFVFRPVNQPVNTGLVIYPGGRVDPRSYAPTAAGIAENGYLVVITPAPFNLSVFNPGIAIDVINAYPEIENWIVAGHSLGGSMAANFARNNPQVVDGLVLWASYPATTDDLSSFNLPVLSIYGTLDGLTTLEDIQSSRQLLPQNTTWVSIEGGNHAQFGWYGEQGGDNPAEIERESQQNLIINATSDFLEVLEEK